MEEFLPFSSLSPPMPCTCNCENASESPGVLRSKHNPEVLRRVQRINLNATLSSVRLHLLVIPLPLQFMVGSPYAWLYPGGNESYCVFRSQWDYIYNVWPVEFILCFMKQGKPDEYQGLPIRFLKTKKPNSVSEIFEPDICLLKLE